MSKEETKKFYRNLGMKNREAREPPTLTEAETYWKSLWGEEQNGYEGKRKEKLGIWIEGLYTLWKLLGTC